MALYLDQNLLPKQHSQSTDFFLKKNFKNFNQVVEPSKIKDITDVQLQCLGYGIFDKQIVLNNFVKYIIDVIQTCSQEKSPIKSFKIQLNGFQLSPQKEFFIRIGKQILAIKENLKVLWIHTSNIKRVTLKQFQYLLKLSVELTDINFQDFSLQCANWRFSKVQPSFKDLQKIFTSLIQSASDLQTIKNKHFRLELSGWYYQKYDAHYLLGFKTQEDQVQKLNLQRIYSIGNRYDEGIFGKQVQIFHLAMERFLKELLNCMDQIQEFQLDIRNWNQDLKMKVLKKKLDNVTKQNRYQASIVSKRYDIQADQAQKQLKLIIVM